VIFATGSIVGAAIAPNMSLATMPLSVYVVGMAAGTLPAGWVARTYGRRVAFLIGAGAAIAAPLLRLVAP
jgi:MFS family permease